jgi:hypothetical protein
MTLKAEIERYSVLLFQKTCKYKVAKKKFINSFCAGFYSKGYMKKMKNNLETALYQNLRIKKKFKAALQYLMVNLANIKICMKLREKMII